MSETSEKSTNQLDNDPINSTPIPKSKSGDFDLELWRRPWNFNVECDGIDKRKVSAVIAARLSSYKEDNLLGKDLWLTFRSHFEKWTPENFKAAHVEATSLRDYLLSHGVRLDCRKTNLPIPMQLMSALSQDEFPLWTEEDLNWAFVKFPDLAELCNDTKFYNRIAVREIRRGSYCSLSGPPSPTAQLLENLKSAEQRQQTRAVTFPDTTYQPLYPTLSSQLLKPNPTEYNPQVPTFTTPGPSQTSYKPLHKAQATYMSGTTNTRERGAATFKKQQGSSDGQRPENLSPQDETKYLRLKLEEIRLQLALERQKSQAQQDEAYQKAKITASTYPIRDSTNSRLPVQDSGIARAPGINYQWDMFGQPQLARSFFLPSIRPPPDSTWLGLIDDDKIAKFDKSLRREHKYGGNHDESFDDKIQHFYTKCQIHAIPQNQWGLIIDLWLTGDAFAFFTSNLANKRHELDFFTIASRIKGQFESAERKFAIEGQFDTLSINQVRDANPEKSVLEAFDLWVQKLRTMHSIITPSDMPQHLCNQSLYKRLLVTARQMPKFETASIGMVSQSVDGLIEQMRSAFIDMDCKSKDQYLQNCNIYPPSTGQAFWTERRFHDIRQSANNPNSPENDFGLTPSRRNNSRYLPSQNSGRTMKVNLPTQARNRQIPGRSPCRVCNKVGCWSTNHKDQRNFFRKQYRQYIADSSITDKEADPEHFIQYLMDEEQNENRDDYDFILDALHGVDLDSAVESFPQDIADDFENTSEQVVVELFATQTNGKEMVTTLNDNIARHVLTSKDPNLVVRSSEAFFLDRYNSDTFQGIMLDPGAAGYSTAGEPQLIALTRIRPDVKLNRDTAGEANIRFGPGKTLSSIGTTTVETPIGTIPFHVLPSHTLFLFCLQDMDRMGVEFRNLTNTIEKGNIRLPVERKFGHAWMSLDHPSPASFSCHLTEVELKRIHRRFGHPSVKRLYDILRQAGTPVQYEAIEKLASVCNHCQLNSRSPQRFRFNLRDPEKILFNYEIIVDILTLDGRNVLHVVDLSTAFQAARFLPSLTAKALWDALRSAWIDVYLGPPDWITTDAGSNFRSTEFHAYSKSMNIEVRHVPTEAHHGIGTVERYHTELRRAYTIIKAETGDNPEVVLQAAVKALNDTAGPNGLVPTLLVFGAYARTHAASPPSLNIQRRAEAIAKAMKEIAQIRARTKVNNALNVRNGPVTTPTLQLPIMSSVRVWREKGGPLKRGAWTGPFRLIGIEDETCTVETAHGRSIRFPSTAVKPYNHGDEVEPLETHETFTLAKEKEALEKSKVFRQEGKIKTPGLPFEESTTTEIEGLLARDVFELVKYDPNIHHGRIFRARFVHDIKGDKESPYEKSRLVVQGYNDEGKKEILTQAPTVQRASQRLVLALAPSLLKRGCKLWVRDITQAYVQSDTYLKRTIYAWPPKELGTDVETLMIIKKPLYGVAEAGNHWWSTYQRHHKERLAMLTTTFDPCLMVTQTNPSFAIIAMQTDDTLGLSDDVFSDLEEAKLKEAGFAAKPKKFLDEKSYIIFNGAKLILQGDNIVMTQKGQVSNISLVRPGDKTEYLRQRARGAYIATLCQPEALFDLTVAAQHIDPR